MQISVGMKAVIVHEGRILLLREAAYDEGTNEGKWDVPGGRIQPEEPIFEGLAREVLEESGLTVEPLKVLGVFENFPVIKNETHHIVRIYYLCYAKDTAIALSGDHSAYAWVGRADVGEKALVGSLGKILTRAWEEIPPKI